MDFGAKGLGARLRGAPGARLAARSLGGPKAPTRGCGPTAHRQGAFRAVACTPPRLPGPSAFGAAGSTIAKVARIARGSVTQQNGNIAMKAAVASAAPTEWEGAKPVPLAITLAIGLVIRFLVPVPEGITMKGWTLLSIFLSTICGLVLEPLPTGAVAFLGLTATILSGTLTFAQATAAMTSEVIWLIVVSFFFAKGFELTGLGRRVAFLFVKVFGKNTLGLSYGLNVAEGFISPAMPSTTARAGGIFVPIMANIARNAGSTPDSNRTKLGAFLVHSQFQTSSHTSALFLTAAAQNLLCLKLAADTIGTIGNQFVTWTLGALAPAVAGLVLCPLLMYQMMPPELKATPEAPKEAEKQLENMGPMSSKEWIMLGTMLLAITLWVFGESLGIPAVLAAMMGLCILLLSGTLKWQECLNYAPAWDTLFWFAVLIGLSGQLNSMGIISAFSAKCGAFLTSLNLGTMPLFVILHVVFFAIHYLFASQTAHVAALYSAFLTLMLSAGVPPLMAALSLAYNANLFGSITQFASGQAAVYYGSGFMTLQEVFKIGALFAFLNLTLWLGIGIPWWKVLGWW
eukprot:evm.model.scf_1215EXC.5 EVM.evm.TU.scf_1215EXC.5   scf_1215EXC:28331-33596(-)